MIQLTEKAAKKIQQHIERRGKGVGITVGVRTTGCSGLAYKLEYVDELPESEEGTTFESNGVYVWVAAKDLPYVNGLTMDYKRQGLNEGFDFINPNERDRCGCGESFRI